MHRLAAQIRHPCSRASPHLFNAGTCSPQLSSCFLLTVTDDSIEGIYETLKRCALISKTAGGIGLSIHNIRATNSYISGTNGCSNGIVPMLRVYNDTARYVDQGGGKRKGAFAIYLEPWHADIFEFLDLKKNHGKEEARARDLFYAMWTPDLFMKRVEADGDWSLFCPNECPGLADCWGEDFEALYEKYEKTEGAARKVVKAQKLWFAILESQVETGTPYMLYKVEFLLCRLLRAVHIRVLLAIQRTRGRPEQPQQLTSFCCDSVGLLQPEIKSAESWDD